MNTNDLEMVKQLKEVLLDKLLLELKETGDAMRRNQLALFIVDHFRGAAILPALMQLATDKALA